MQLGKHFPIRGKETLGPDIFSMWIEAPDIVRAFEPGQFLIVRIHDLSERIPLTIVDTDKQRGWIRLLVQVVGRTTREMSALQEGDSLLDVAGPLGLGLHINPEIKTYICVGGGIGIAPLYPKAKDLHARGLRVLSIIGARQRDLLVLEEEMRGVSDELVVCTDDGSYGRRALVTQPLAELLDQLAESGGLEVIAIGPPIMMKAVCAVTQKYRTPTLVSLNPIMIDGTGMCGGCRVSHDGKVQFACVDGPIFDGAAIDWDELISRLKTYTPLERQALDHACRLERR